MSNSLLPTILQDIIHKTMYSRFLWEDGRRESWEETVARYFDFFEDFLLKNNNYKMPDRDELERAVLNLDIIPSMRALMTAGPAAWRDQVSIFNCSYLPIDRPTAFDELMYILMCGTGVGYSVERQYVNQLPTIAEDFHYTDTTITVADSKLGWAKAFKELVHLLYGGQIPKWDLSKVRPAGTPLKTFGGRASGPEPLDDLFKFSVTLFKNAAGRKLNSLECHDLACKIGEVVVVGGVRRSALISLSNLSDDRLRYAKSGEWWNVAPHRRLANNSTAYTEKPDTGQFLREWLALYDSKSGERGIFNREAAKRTAERSGRRDIDIEYGTNPCSEIYLRPAEFCNLTAAVVRENDTPETIAEKVRKATILGTYQSCATDFRYLSKRWQNNCDEERLLGVSFTGIMDNPYTSGKKGKLEELLKSLKQTCIDVNKQRAKEIGIPQSAAITCVKPSGNSSQLLDTASGIHARYAPYYIRRVRFDKKNPISQLLIATGIPHEDDIMAPASTWVFSFPIKAPKGALTRNDLNAMDQLAIWLQYKLHWCEHNPSVTITVREHEWLSVGAWVYENFDEIGGLSFLPHSDHNYKQAPYEECDKATYDKLVAAMPTAIDWSQLHERDDQTTGSQELACGGKDSCEII